ncbi:universal stress protein [Roseateles violae]|uniref:Universal stress protein n=1 Tax=Roseateles violae TaxID=3058042 RepID=A0ABT8DT46_9BURK|nr:universal stress protein [Pelomonas sp. PFR6]MDN3919336.1 universal stress protein [Pelomonas sp. PFR6]
MKILVAIDGSVYSQRLLDYLAANREAWLGSSNRCTLLHAVLPVPPHAASMLDRNLLKDYYREEGEKVLQPAREFFAKHGFEAEFVCKVGSPASVISSTAEAEHYDLLMLGSHGHSSLGNLVMGSVATKVMAHCGVPVLLVR